jgi:type VI secretion system secreted protein VgrG
MASLTQDGRLIALTTPLGKDALVLTGFTGREAISRLFRFDLKTFAQAGSTVDFEKIVGQNVTITVLQAGGKKRFFNGFVSNFAAVGGDAHSVHYELQVVPWVWMLTRESDCRIFHNKNVQQIVEQVFSDRGYHDYKFQLSGSYSPIEYCVQYRETDFNFISRLLEQYGIFYFFEHNDGSHILHIADSPNAIQPCPGQPNAGYYLTYGSLKKDDAVDSLTLEQEMKTGKYTLRDYNFKTPSTDLTGSESTIYATGGNAKFEIFDYPGLYENRSEAKAAATVRMQEEEASHLAGHGASTCRSFTTGYKFEMKDHPVKLLNKTYVLTEIWHMASVSGTYSVSKDEQSGEAYSNHFTCIPDDVRFRPARITPKPFVQGPQTAVVTGDAGEEIWVDKYGRVQLLFPWDRKKDLSCWVRVSQDWAGQNWGMINIPRVGQEVVVSFIEGDPDRPLITGRVYNAEQAVPYPLPDNKTRTTFKTRSSKGGGASNYNELRFEDKTGSEQVYLQGEKDLDIQVKHDAREQIGNDRSLIVKHNSMEQVDGDLSLQVKGNQSEAIGSDLSHTVSGDFHQSTNGTISLVAGQNLYEQSGQNYAHSAGQAIHLKAGMTVVIEAGVQLSLKASGNFIDIGPAGVSISGTMVMINSGGAAGSGCGSSPKSPKNPKLPDLADDGSKGTKMN